MRKRTGISAVLRALWRPATKRDPNQDECERGRGDDEEPVPRPPGYSPTGIVRRIELTDDGEFADRCQLTDVLYEIRNPEKSVLVVWYIHGWKHSADKDDSDFRHFGSLIRELVGQQGQLGDAGRHVVGVYVGWDGAVGPAALRNLTFWNRKRAADRISQSGVLTKIIASTKYARKRELEKRGGDASRDLTIMIAHSFGARILYTATAQVLLDEVQRRHPGNHSNCYEVIEGPADLILLLNPAFEASIFTAMHTIRRPDAKPWERVNSLQQPVLLTISTENDWATGWAFPFARCLEFATRDRQRLTIGNYPKYVTHDLEAASSDSGKSLKGALWFDSFEAGGLRLKLRESTRQRGNPFVIARTTSDIIDGHNGIWEGALRNWTMSFLGEVQKHSPVAS